MTVKKKKSPYGFKTIVSMWLTMLQLGQFVADRSQQTAQL